MGDFNDLTMLYKLIILFMLDNSEKPLSNAQISEFVLEKEYTNYFQLQQTISELKESKLIIAKTIKNSTYYHLSENGKTTLSYFNNEISAGIKKDVKAYLKANSQESSVVSTSDYYKKPQGNYSVRCQILEKGSERLELTLVLPSEDAAKAVQSNWKKKSQDIYAILMEELL